jgi:hypothetical protein
MQKEGHAFIGAASLEARFLKKRAGIKSARLRLGILGWEAAFFVLAKGQDGGGGLAGREGSRSFGKQAKGRCQKPAAKKRRRREGGEKNELGKARRPKADRAPDFFEGRLAVRKP